MNETEQHIKSKSRKRFIQWHDFADKDIASAKLSGIDFDCVDLAILTNYGQIAEISLTKADVVALGKALNLNLTNTEEECTISTT